MFRTARETGSAMLVAVIVVIIVIGIGGAFLADTVFKAKATFSAIENDEATVICEAAMEKTRRALFVYRSTGSLNWNDLLVICQNMSTDYNQISAMYLANVFGSSTGTTTTTTGSNTPPSCNSQDFVAYRANQDEPGVATANDAPLPGDPDFFFGAIKPYSEGGFHVAIRDNNEEALGLETPNNPTVDQDQKVLAVVTSVLPDGSIRQIEALLEFNSGFFDPDMAIVTNGSLMINGNPNIVGLKGSVHANVDLFITGNPSIAQNATAAGNLFVSGSPTVGGTASGSAPAVPVPAIDPQQFFPLRTFYLRADGMILDAAGTILFNGTTGNKWHGINWSSGSPPKWSFSNPGGQGPPLPGAYFIEGEAHLSSNIGNQGSDPPIQITLIATDSIEISGNPGIIPFLGDVQAIAGTDLKINGNSSMDTFVGFYAAHEQIMISGNPNMQGSIVGEDAEDLDSTVSLGTVGTSDLSAQTSGNPTIQYDGGLQTLIATAQSVTIRHLRKIK